MTPQNGPMRSVTEVRDHLSGDRIPCLICGRLFRAVGHHVRHAHGISARAYKQRFGLPVSRGVATSDVREVWRESILRTRETGLIQQRQAPKGSHGVLPAYTWDMPRIDPGLAEKLFAALHSGHTITEAYALPGMPKWTWLHKRLTRDPELQLRLDAVIESLPFAQQARMKKLGARFAAAVDAHAGKTALAISDALGVSQEAVRRQIKRNAHHVE